MTDFVPVFPRPSLSGCISLSLALNLPLANTIRTSVMLGIYSPSLLCHALLEIYPPSLLCHTLSTFFPVLFTPRLIFLPPFNPPSPASHPPIPEHSSCNSHDNSSSNDDNNSSELQSRRACVGRGGWKRVICGRSFAAVKFTYRFHVHCCDGRAGSFFSLKTR